MGKWSGLRKTCELAPEDESAQYLVNEKKKDYLENTLAEKGKLYVGFRDKKDTLEAEVKKLNIEIAALSQLMISDMENDGLNLMRLDTGETLSIKDDPYTSVQDKPKFLAWVRKEGREDLLTVNYQTMSAMVKTRLEEGLNLPDGLKLYLKQSIRKLKART